MNLGVLIGLIIATVAAGAAIVVVLPTRRSSRPAAVAEERDRFKSRYKELRDRQVLLGDDLLRESPRAWQASDIPMLTTTGWILDRPRDIGIIDMTLNPSDADPELSKLKAESKVLHALSLAGNMSYSEALLDLNPNASYFNGTIYRPVHVSGDGRDHLSMTFEDGKYFDYLDTSEVLAYEATLRPKELGARRRITNPFDLTNRVASLGVLTLTIQMSPSGPTFIMHKRSGKFAVGDALYHVVPAGEFTPSDVGRAAVEADFSLWRNIIREYAEELSGIPDAQGQGGRRLDYEHAAPYREMQDALAADRLRVRTFGIALDPLTFKPELLTVAIFDRTTFDAIFPTPLSVTDEGVIIEDIPFTEESIRSYVDIPTTRHGAKACLQLAWRYRHELGL